MDLTASLPLHRYRCTCTSSSCKYSVRIIFYHILCELSLVSSHQSSINPNPSFALPCPALPWIVRRGIRYEPWLLDHPPWAAAHDLGSNQPVRYSILHPYFYLSSKSEITAYLPTISTFCIFVNLSFLFLSFPNHPPVTLAFLSDSPLVMLFTKSSRRRLETFHIIAIVGAFILLLKVCYQSVSWPQSYFPTVQLGANNSTLGVCYQLAFLLIPYRRLTNS